MAITHIKHIREILQRDPREALLTRALETIIANSHERFATDMARDALIALKKLERQQEQEVYD